MQNRSRTRRVSRRLPRRRERLGRGCPGGGRYGGGVHTERHLRKGRKPLVYELGGEWIGADHGRMIKLAKHFTCHSWSTAMPCHSGGRAMPSRLIRRRHLPFPRTIKQKFQTFCDQVKRHQKNLAWNKEIPHRIDWWTRLKEMGLNEDELERRDLMDSTDFGESIRQTSRTPPLRSTPSAIRSMKWIRKLSAETTPARATPSSARSMRSWTSLHKTRKLFESNKRATGSR